MYGHMAQHVIEKGHTRSAVPDARAIQVQPQMDVRFGLTHTMQPWFAGGALAELVEHQAAKLGVPRWRLHPGAVSK